ncbi:MAG: hypothetical protein HZB55_16320 [Deltaproteobacteria bacterium]|nr:hypothetical protein [Deltaproteobacteria bacterium]
MVRFPRLAPHRGLARILRCALLWFAVALAAASAFVLLAGAVLVARPDLFRSLLLRALAPAGGHASASRLSLTLNPPALVLDDLSLAGPRPDDDRLTIDHLGVEFAPRRLLDGGPWLARVETRGLRFERTRPRPTERPPDLTALRWVFRMRELSVSDARVLFAVPQGIVKVEGLRVSLAPDRGVNRRFRGEATVSLSRGASTLAVGNVESVGLAVPGPALEAALSLTRGRLDLPRLSTDVLGHGAFRLTPKVVEARDVTLDLPGARWHAEGREPVDLGRAHLSAAGSATLDGRDPRLEVRLLDVPRVVRARGRRSGRSTFDVVGTLEGALPDTSRLWALLSPLLPSNVPAVEAAGGLPFRCRLDAGRRGTRALALELFPRSLALGVPQWGVSARLSGWFRAGGPLEDWSTARVALGGHLDAVGRWRRGALELGTFRLVAPVSGNLSAPTLASASVSAPAGGVVYEGRPIPLGRLELRGSAATEPGGFRVEGLDLTSETLGRLTGRLAFGRGGSRGGLRGQRLRFPSALAVAGALVGADWSRWNSTGEVGLDVRVEPAGGETAVVASATAEQVGFSSPAGDQMGQHLGGRLALEARLGSPLRLSGDLASAHGEALWGTTYADLAQAPLRVRFGLTRTGPERYRDLRFEGRLGGFGSVAVRAEASRGARGWAHRGRIVVSEANLGRLFSTFVRDPLAPSHPGLTGLEAEGTAAANLAFSGLGRTADLSGRVSLRSGALRRKGAPPFVSGLELDLPVAYAFGKPDPGRAGPAAGTSWGRLRVRQFAAAGQEAGPIDLPAALVPNRLVLGGSIDLPLFGGRLSLHRIGVGEPLSSKFRLEARAALDDLDLGRLPTKSALRRGHLGGVLDPLRLTRDELTTSGTLAGDFLGGRLEIRDPSVARPLSPGREIGADVNLALLDLEQLSAALDLGRITGRVTGSARGLRVAYGQPVAFHLRMESVPVKGVGQLVSLKAVNSISLLGTGSALGGLGLSIMTRFFREFPYDRMGFECDLRNDVFTVRGLIRENGVEYLVKRPAFSGINVVNSNPDNRISFSDMIDRLKRVTDKGASPDLAH